MNSSPSITKSEHYFTELQRIAAQMPFAVIDDAIAAVSQACEQARTVYLFGNGGSAALASHFACDLAKGVSHYSPGRRFRAIALTDNIPILTAWANDSSYDDVFAEPLANLVQPQDLVIAISGSGNSRNVLRALEVARAAHARTIGFTGFQGGRMKSLCDICIIVPSDNMQIIEDLHLSMAHTVFTVITNSRRALARSAAARAGD